MKHNRTGMLILLIGWALLTGCAAGAGTVHDENAVAGGRMDSTRIEVQDVQVSGRNLDAALKKASRRAVEELLARYNFHSGTPVANFVFEKCRREGYGWLIDSHRVRDRRAQGGSGVLVRVDFTLNPEALLAQIRDAVTDLKGRWQNAHGESLGFLAAFVVRDEKELLTTVDLGTSRDLEAAAVAYAAQRGQDMTGAVERVFSDVDLPVVPNGRVFSNRVAGLSGTRVEEAEGETDYVDVLFRADLDEALRTLGEAAADAAGVSHLIAGQVNVFEARRDGKGYRVKATVDGRILPVGKGARGRARPSRLYGEVIETGPDLQRTLTRVYRTAAAQVVRHEALGLLTPSTMAAGPVEVQLCGVDSKARKLLKGALKSLGELRKLGNAKAGGMKVRRYSLVVSARHTGLIGDTEALADNLAERSDIAPLDLHFEDDGDLLRIARTGGDLERCQ